MAILKESEMNAIKDLQSLEATCIEKYSRYSKEAKDPVVTCSRHLMPCI